MAAHPGDPSDRTYVVDDPPAAQRMVLSRSTAYRRDGGWSRPSAG